jgi:hypothetical protein
MFKGVPSTLDVLSMRQKGWGCQGVFSATKTGAKWCSAPIALAKKSLPLI